MKDYSGYTNEDLASLITSGEEEAYEQLFANMRPLTMREAAPYHKKMATYDDEDFIQEGRIVIWKIISRGNFNGGKFTTYYATAIKYRLANIYRDYCLKNLIVLREDADEKGEGYNKTVLAEASYAEAYREKHRRHCRESYARKKAKEAEARRAAGIPDPEPKVKMTQEERNAKALAYYHAHREEINAKKKAKREAAKTRKK